MLISIDRKASEPLYVQIKNKLRSLIENGTLPPGYCLPPERKLAESLGVNRTTILNAFRDLKSEDFLSKLSKMVLFSYPGRYFTWRTPPKSTSGLILPIRN